MTHPDAEAPPPRGSRRAALHQIVFEADTPAGRLFDIAIIGLIVTSVLVVSLETVQGTSPALHSAMRTAEWVLTALFTIEYVLRLVAVRRPLAYATSFFGVVDLLAILPTWVSIFIPGAQALLVVRVLRILRIFRVLKMVRFITEAHTLRNALRASARKITVFLTFVGTIIVIVGSVMFFIEGEAAGFTSIPRGMYWTVVTLTTVGYGDIAPVTPIGQAIASFVMILGYGIIAVPTGIVTAELTIGGHDRLRVTTQACPDCATDIHDPDARFCRKCGAKLE